MKVLSDTESSSISGGLWNFVIGSAIGLGGYVVHKKKDDEPMTLPGVVTAMGFGAATGGLGCWAAGAAGGGWVGHLAWRPGFMAINAAGQAIAIQK